MKFNKRFFESFGANRAVVALSFARLTDGIGNSILFIILPLYVAKTPDYLFNFSTPVLVGILISLYGFVNTLVQPLMGALTDRLGRRKLLIQVGLGIIGIATFGFVFAQNYLELLLLRITQGIAFAITITASMALLAVITKRETRGGSMGVFSTFRMVGFGIGPILGGFLKTRFGFNAAFYTGAGLILAAVVFIQIWVKDVRGEATVKKKRKFKIIEFSLLGAGILSAAAATFLMASAFSMITALENEFNKRLDITAVGFGIAFSTLMISRIIFQVPLGHYSDKIGRRPLIIIGLLIMGVATILLGMTISLTGLIIDRFVQGIASACIAAPAFAVAADLSKKGREGRQMSFVTMGFGLGIAFGPLAAGLLANFFFELPFLSVGIVTMGGAWIVYKYMPETAERIEV